MSPDSGCSGATCIPITAAEQGGQGTYGLHTVTGTKGTATAYATLYVASFLGIFELGQSHISLGQSMSYSVVSRTALGNTIGDVTTYCTFTITTDGSCTGNTCTPAAAGNHMVAATFGILSIQIGLPVN